MNTSGRPKKIQDQVNQIKHYFDASGVSITDWANKKGFLARHVYQIFSDARMPKRGRRHEIAVALGLKPDTTGNYVDLEQELKSMSHAHRHRT